MEGHSTRPAASAVQQQHAPRSAHHLPAVAQHAQPLLHRWLDETLRATDLQGNTVQPQATRQHQLSGIGAMQINLIRR
jgi:hypothetical protein